MSDRVGCPAGGRLERPALVRALSEAGCVAAHEEADDLLRVAAHDADRLDRLLARRMAGEPLAWVTGSTPFAGHRLLVHRGVFVPRRQTEALAARAVEALPERGVAVDLCTGSGAVAVTLSHARPRARVVATDIDPAACRCARDNGVEVFEGHLGDPLPRQFPGTVDVVTAVAPYVPHDSLELLPRDAREWEPSRALDGGAGGVEIVEEVLEVAARLLRRGGRAFLELGDDQDRAIARALDRSGLTIVARILDNEGDLRGIVAAYP